MKKLKIIIPVFVVLAIFIYFTFYVEISNIECNSTDGACDQELLRSLNGSLPDNIYDAKTKIGRILEGETVVRSYNLRFRFPNKLIVNIEKFQPEFALRTEEEDTWYSIVEKNGMVISVEDNTQLEPLYASELINPGDHVSAEMLSAYELYKNIKPYFDIEKAALREDSLFLETKQGLQAMLPYNKDIELLIGSVLVVFNRLNYSTEESIIDNRDNSKLYNLCSNGCMVDFRFKNPVIKDKI